MTRQEAHRRILVASKKLWDRTHVDVQDQFYGIIQRHVCEITPTLENVPEDDITRIVHEFEALAEGRAQ